MDIREIFQSSSFDIKNNKSQFLILVVLVALIVVVLYLYFVLRPQIIRISVLLDKTGTTMSQLKIAESDIKRMDILKKEISLFDSKVTMYEKRLPAEQEIPSLLEALSAMAKKSNVTITAITPAAIQPVKDEQAQKDSIYKEVPILISAKSGYHELGAFLSNLENADRFMKVVDIEIKGAKLSPRKHDVELLVSTYILLKEGAK